MTPAQSVRFLRAGGFEDAASVLEREYKRLVALKGQKDVGWPVGLAIGDYAAGTGVPVSMALAGQIKTALDRVIQDAARRRGSSPAAVWEDLRPCWQTWCNDDKAPAFGPEQFARAPRAWQPSLLSTVGAYVSTGTR